MAKDGAKELICLASSPVTGVKQAGWQTGRPKFEFWRFFKILYLAACMWFLVLILYLILDELVLFCTGDFCYIIMSVG